jgi:hypothetical protein
MSSPRPCSQWQIADRSGPSDERAAEQWIEADERRMASWCGARSLIQCSTDMVWKARDAVTVPGMNDDRLNTLLYAFTGEEEIRSLRAPARVVVAALAGAGILLFAWVRWSLQHDIGGTPLAMLLAVLGIGHQFNRLALERLGRDPKTGMSAWIVLGTPLIGIPLFGILGQPWVVKGTALGVLISGTVSIGASLFVSRRRGTVPRANS